SKASTGGLAGPDGSLMAPSYRKHRRLGIDLQGDRRRGPPRRDRAFHPLPSRGRAHTGLGAAMVIGAPVEGWRNVTEAAWRRSSEGSSTTVGAASTRGRAELGP